MCKKKAEATLLPLPSFCTLFPHQKLLELPDLGQLFMGELLGALDAAEAQEEIRTDIVQPADLHQQVMAGGAFLLLPALHRRDGNIKPGR